jgi:hypothetical protein
LNSQPLFAAQNLFNSSNYSCLSKCWNIRVIPKVRKTQHQNPEFGNTQDEIQKKNLQKSTLAFNGGWNSENHQFWWEIEFHPVFPFS